MKVPWVSLTIWWLAESSFTHVTVVPFGAVILAGVNAKFWIVMVGAPGITIGVVVGMVVDDGP